MGKRVLIDLHKLRDLKENKIEGILPEKNSSSFKTIRELAIFQYTCRKCENAPCINACPADALSRDDDKIVKRAVNLCIRCKSCIVICPFGTLMNELFEVKTSGYKYYDLNDEKERNLFVKEFPDEVVCLTDKDENPEENIYKLEENILIKEFVYK